MDLLGIVICFCNYTFVGTIERASLVFQLWQKTRFSLKAKEGVAKLVSNWNEFKLKQLTLFFPRYHWYPTHHNQQRKESPESTTKNQHTTTNKEKNHQNPQQRTNTLKNIESANGAPNVNINAVVFN